MKNLELLKVVKVNKMHNSIREDKIRIYKQPCNILFII